MNDQIFTETINYYINLYGMLLSFENVSPDDLKNDICVLEECEEFVLNLFCTIGLKDDFEPNEEGIVLDKCLEYINDIRYKFHGLNT